jgi:hypothetical protein
VNDVYRHPAERFVDLDPPRLALAEPAVSSSPSGPRAFDDLAGESFTFVHEDAENLESATQEPLTGDRFVGAIACGLAGAFAVLLLILG